MPQAAHQWVKQLAGETLPVLQRTLTQVRDLLHKTSVNHHKLAEVISRDPGFCLHIIRQFSSLPNAPKEPVSSIARAIPLLGMDQVERASCSLPCLEDLLKGPPRRGLVSCYSRAAHAAFYAGTLAQRRRDPDEGAVYTAALLHDLGEMLLWTREPNLMRQAESLVQAGEGQQDAALEIFGCTFQEISAGLSEGWALPELISTSQGLFNSYQPRPLSIMLSSALARESSLGWQRPATLNHIELLAEFLEQPLDKTLAWLHTQAAEAARQLQSLPISLPAFRLIHGDAESPQGKKQPCEATTTVDKTPPACPAPSAPSDEAPPSAEPPPPVAKPAPTPATKPEPATAAAKAANPLQQLLHGALLELRQTHGLERVMFAMLNGDRSKLQARMNLETNSPPSLKGFQVDLVPPNLFSLLIKKPLALSLNRENSKKYILMVPAPLRDLINPHQCLLLSVFLRNKPVGLFYADNGVDGEITPQQFANFKAVCQRTIQRLS
jgi:outer membrane biosynthesis protein TonB